MPHLEQSQKCLGLQVHLGTSGPAASWPHCSWFRRGLEGWASADICSLENPAPLIAKQILLEWFFCKILFSVWILPLGSGCFPVSIFIILTPGMGDSLEVLPTHECALDMACKLQHDALHEQAGIQPLYRNWCTLPLAIPLLPPWKHGDFAFAEMFLSSVFFWALSFEVWGM